MEKKCLKGDIYKTSPCIFEGIHCKTDHIEPGKFTLWQKEVITRYIHGIHGYPKGMFTKEFLEELDVILKRSNLVGIWK